MENIPVYTCNSFNVHIIIHSWFVDVKEGHQSDPEYVILIIP